MWWKLRLHASGVISLQRAEYRAVRNVLRGDPAVWFVDRWALKCLNRTALLATKWLLETIVLLRPVDPFASETSMGSRARGPQTVEGGVTLPGLLLLRSC